MKQKSRSNRPHSSTKTSGKPQQRRAKSYKQKKRTKSHDSRALELVKQIAPGIPSLVDKIPQEFRRLIDKTTVDLSAASPFCKKKAGIVEVFKDFVEVLPNSHYLLKNGLDQWYLSNLRLYGGRDPKEPADTLAEALFHLAYHWARIEYGHLPKRTELYEQFLAEPWDQVNEDLIQFLKLNSFSVDTFLYVVRDDYTLAAANWRTSMQRPVELSLAFATSLHQPPGMTLEIKGKPVATFMHWRMLIERLGFDRAHREHQAVRKQARTLLRSVFKSLETTMQLRQAGRGRPSKSLAELAAYAIDHLGRSVPAVSRELCELRIQPGHRCKQQCYDRIRKGVSNYYKQQRHQLQTLILVNPEKIS